MSVGDGAVGKAVWHDMTTTYLAVPVSLPMRAAIRSELIEDNKPGIMWELRRTLPHLGYSVLNGDYRVINRLKNKKWDELGHTYDLTMREHFKYSFKSANFHHKSIAECSP